MSRKEKRKEKKKKIATKNKVLIAILIMVLIIAAGLGIWKVIIEKQEVEEVPISLGEEQGIEDVKEPEKTVQIFSGNDRPIAVMIDNHKGAWPQAGLNNAYCVYEIIVEGGETRLMALFKGKEDQIIGPVRSARHYFLDYAMENDAIYTHYGWSPQAESDIRTYKVQNINGISESSKDFWRIKQKSAPHNVLTNISNIKKIAERKEYRITSDQKSVLNYSADEIELASQQVANTVTIPYSTLHTTSYVYDPETKLYTRYARNTKQTDYNTKEAITTKNIIITFAENYTLKDGENKDRQGLKNIGTKDGYYITNGKAIPIVCEKKDRDSQTIYKDMNGNIIQVNDGNTFINICPIDSKVTFE